jgi:hypothetical protein
MVLTRFFVVAAIALAGCAAPDDGDWGGSVAGSDAWIGLSISEQQVSAYVCGGASTVATHTRWFSGARRGGAFELERHGWILRGAEYGSGMRGELVDPRGVETTWKAAKTSELHMGGLYAAVDSGCRAGAIVVDGEQPAALQGAWCDGAGMVMQVTPVQPIARLADPRAGITLRVELPAGPHEFVVYPLRAR